MIAMEAEPARVFGFISDPNNGEMFTHVGARRSNEQVPVQVDAAAQRIEWTSDTTEPCRGAMWLRGGDATPEITEVTMQVDLPDRPEDDGRGEEVLEQMQKALEEIRRQVR
jgi:hypothetical protein